MDIREIQSRNTGAADESRGPRAVGPTPAAGASTDPSTDRVTLSARAQALQEVRRAALSVPEVRNDVVTETRGRVADGTLVPDPERIARALIDQGVIQ
ncbi:MAG: flagellar biosynthesis anti-sigma factor FlgM [Candidatus Rokubacteria bacterium]|nr:flagellar biosynthesis anti-sigma factor FlgM [Candidatus Rokubacteria bacterium]